MKTTFETFERDIRVATAGMEPEAVSKMLAAFAREELAKAIAEGVASPEYERFVNGRRGAVEESVIPPGPILYVFTNWKLLITAALAELQKRSPRAKSGRFAASFIVIVNGALVATFEDIPADAEVIITNAQPYVRKAEVGRLGIPKRRLFDGTKRAMARKYGESFRFETQFLNISAGLHPLIPYRLRRSGGRGKDRQAGSALAYPSIVMNAL